uniref:Long-chain-alcohol oxidase FAO4A n=2 Tax=Anthurium amnicola TaxID=1678845 RepID=A0A1D1Y7Q9_9ARAE
MDNMYESAGLRTTDNMGVLVLAGSGVGGGSAVNWSASIRTPQHVMEEWCDVHGLELFGSRAYREALDAVCARMGVQTEVSDEGFNNAVLRRGCGELGYPVQTIPRNAGADHYCGWCCFGCKDGKKKGTSETWLVDMADSGNGVVLPRCTAVKVLQDRRQLHCGRRPVATGVLVQFDGDEEEEEGGAAGKQRGAGEMWVVEAKVTVVACGALRTPELLLRSGLRNPNIGRHLHLHPVVMAWGHFPRERASRWPEVEKRSYEGGIMTAMSTVVANFKSGSGYGAIIQTPALHPGMFSVLTPWTSGADIKERMTRFSRTAHIFALARDRGCGDVRAYPGSLRYQLDGEDEEHLQRGMEKMLRILAAAGAEEIGTQHRAGRRLNVKTASSHEFERFVRRESRRGLRKDLPTPICSAHQMGSCRMGLAPGTSAVDPRGETWEVEGLYVADTSTFPTALGVNPMVTVQAVAYCTAQSILHLLSRTKKKNTTTTATHR